MKKNESKTESRRKFLKKAGIFAIYTPPALMIMSQANANGISKSGGQCIPKKYEGGGSGGCPT